MMQSPSGGYGAPPPMYQPMGPGPMGSTSPAGSPMPPNYLSAQLPRDASSTLYVEGLPSDATEREVAHIFRRFEGHVSASPLHSQESVPPPPVPRSIGPQQLRKRKPLCPLVPTRPVCLFPAPIKQRFSPIARASPFGEPNVAMLATHRTPRCLARAVVCRPTTGTGPACREPSSPPCAPRPHMIQTVASPSLATLNPCPQLRRHSPPP